MIDRAEVAINAPTIYFRGNLPFSIEYANEALGRCGRSYHVGIPAVDADGKAEDRRLLAGARVAVYCLTIEDFESSDMPPAAILMAIDAFASRCARHQLVIFVPLEELRETEYGDMVEILLYQLRRQETKGQFGVYQDTANLLERLQRA